MADEEQAEQKVPYHPDQDTIDIPGVSAMDRQCFTCDAFYLGRHTGENPHKVVRGVSTGRCPECRAKFDKRVQEIGIGAASREEIEQGDSAHIRHVKYYARETPEAREERLRQSEERERAEREAEQAQKDEGK